MIELLSTSRSRAGSEEAEGDRSAVPIRRRLRRWFFHMLARAVMASHAVAMRVARVVGRSPRPIREGEGQEVLLTGTFYSKNWILPFLLPLVSSQSCARVRIVSTYPVAPTEKVIAIYPPGWLRRVIGAVPARLLVFAWQAMRRRPDVVGGFHIAMNGLAAALVARLAGARSLYICVGGPAEVIDGGLSSENRLFGRMETPDRVVERRLIDAIGDIDLVGTMGSRTVEFFRERGVKKARFSVITGGIDSEKFSPGDEPPLHDLILTARLSRIKRIDVFLEAINIVRSAMPDVRAVIIGRGELEEELREQARELGLDRNVEFLGYLEDVVHHLKRSRIFVLTSDSEGLSLALTEAMMCGVPAVVSDVGELADLVDDGVSGYLVNRRAPGEFAERIIGLLKDERKRAEFAAAARRSALPFETRALSRRWDEILAR